MSDLVRYEKRTEPRLSRASLRAWLEQGGPKSLAQIHAWAKLQVEGIKRAEVADILQSHPRLFTEEEDGSWGATPEETEYRLRKPRKASKAAAPLRSITRAVAEKTKRRPAPPPRPVPQPSTTLFESGGLLVHDGVLKEVLFRRDVAGAEPHETSGMILLLLPQEGRLSAASLEHAQTWVQAAAECKVFEALPDAAPLFRGARRVAHVSVVSEEGRLRVVFDRAPDDAAPRRAFALRSAKPESTSTAVTLAKAGVPTWDEAAVLQALPARIQAAVEAPLPSHRYDPARATTEAQPWLRATAADRTRWNEYVEWLIRKRLAWSREAMEEVVAQTLGLRGIGKDELVRAANLALGVEPIARPSTARTVIRLAPDTESDWLCRWALDVSSVAFSPPESPGGDLYLARAKAASRCGAHEAACADFEAAVAANEPLDPPAVAEYLFSAAVSADPKSMRNAIAFWDQLIGECIDRDHFIRYYAGFDPAFDIAQRLRERVELRFEQLLQAEIECDEQRGVSSARTHVFSEALPLRKDEVFSALSVLENVESLACLEALADLLSELLSRWGPKVRPDLVSKWINQLSCVERFISDQTPRSEFHRRTLSAATATPSETVGAVERPLARRTVALVGGRASTRSRTEPLLRELGVERVEHVPASFDDGFDNARISAVVHSVTDVVLITDYVKHDVQAVLRNMGADICFTAGGPSRIVSGLLTYIHGRSAAGKGPRLTHS